MTKSGKQARHEYVASYKDNISILPLAMANQTPVKILKLLWVIAFIVAASLLITQLSSMIITYRKYPVQAKVTHEARPIVQFPAVTICNLNGMKRSKIRCTEMDGLAAMDVHKSKLWDECANGETLLDAYYEAGSGYYSGSGSGLEDNSTSGSGSGSGDSPDYDYYGSGSGSGDDSASGSGSGYDTGSGSGMYNQYGTTGSGDSDIQPDILPISNVDLLKKFVANVKQNKTSRAVFEDLVKLSKVSDLSDAKGIISISEKQARNYGYTKEEMIVQCSYGITACNETDFTRYYSSRYGNCFTFNTMLVNDKPKTLLTQEYGPDSGLRVTLDVKVDEYVGLLAEDYGVKVVVHSPFQNPDLRGQGFVATVGFRTLAAVKKHTFYRKEEPYTTACERQVKPEYGVAHVAATDKQQHTVRECEKACFSKHLYDCCNCSFVDGGYPKHMNATGRHIKPFSIMNSTHAECRDNISKRMLLKETSQDRISCNCKQSCREEQFTHSLYYSNWPTEALQGLLAYNNPTEYVEKMVEKAKNETGIGYDGFLDYDQVSNKVYDHFTKNLVRLQVYYENLVETITTEYPEITFDQIFADIGGMMGIYLGISIMTFLEVLQFIGLFAWSKMERADGSVKT